MLMSLACGESYESEHVQKALQLIETAMKMTKEDHLDKQLGWCCEVVKYLLTQIKPKEYKADYPVIFETIENFYDKKNSKDTTEHIKILKMLMNMEKLIILHMMRFIGYLINIRIAEKSFQKNTIKQ